MFPAKAGFGIRFELFPRSSQSKRFDKLIIAEKSISFTRNPTWANVLNVRAGEGATIVRNAFQRVLNHEALNVKLAIDEFL